MIPAVADEYFIHVRDPGFPDPPWPGERRLGPFLTLEEAEAQATSDLAHSYITGDGMTGIYTNAESDARAEGLRQAWDEARAQGSSDPYAPPPPFDPATVDAGTPSATATELEQGAVTARRKLLATHARSVSDQRESLQALLPDGVDAEELIAAVSTPEALAKLLAEKPPKQARRKR